jgi:hypothetical protein
VPFDRETTLRKAEPLFREGRANEYRDVSMRLEWLKVQMGGWMKGSRQNAKGRVGGCAFC